MMTLSLPSVEVSTRARTGFSPGGPTKGRGTTRQCSKRENNIEGDVVVGLARLGEFYTCHLPLVDPHLSLHCSTTSHLPSAHGNCCTSALRQPTSHISTATGHPADVALTPTPWGRADLSQLPAPPASTSHSRRRAPPLRVAGEGARHLLWPHPVASPRLGSRTPPPCRIRV